MSNASKFFPHALELQRELEADAVVLIVLGAKRDGLGSGATSVVPASAFLKYQDKLPAMLRFLADDIEKQPHPAPEGKA